MTTAKVFILNDEWNDFNNNHLLKFHGVSNEIGPVQIIIDNVRPVFFVEQGADLPQLNFPFERKGLELKTFENKTVDGLYFNSQRDLNKAAEIFHSQNIRTYESDINPTRRFLMERFINAQVQVTGEFKENGSLKIFVNPKLEPCELNPEFKVASLDIETGFENNMLYSIAVHIWNKDSEEKIVFMLDNKEDRSDYIHFCKSENELLLNFMEWFNKTNPDIIIGWHVIGFDLMFLENKCAELRIPFDLARGKGRVTLKNRKSGSYFAFIPGRIVIDGPVALRAAFYNFDDFKLETVAQDLLGTGKTITPEQNKVAEIENLFRNNKEKLAEYNLQDCVLVSEIFQKTGLIDMSVKRAQLSGMLMDRLGMMTAAFDHFYLPKLHREGFVAPNVRDLTTRQHAAGGYVFDPKPGIYADVIILDFKSLYPSIIQTFKIDPLSRLLSNENTIKTPSKHKFSRTKNFLPEFINQLMEQRAEAKRKKDIYLSHAIKILMNSFYGVMGSYGCRFYHPDLPSAITESGQWLLLQSKDYLEAQGYKVVYGDTDSLFVRLKLDEGLKADLNGSRIASELNEYWKKRLKDEFDVDSFLEMEYEKYYTKFVITPARGGETGAKKRYAGLSMKNNKEKLEFVGMEFVRSDWTKLAKEFQMELYEKVLKNKDIIEYVKSVVNDLKKGIFDDKLIYRKRLRKSVDQYVKNVPPQVKAARMLKTPGGSVDYVITKGGPVPVELNPKDIDYQHYIDKQLKPIADSLLILLGESFDSIVKEGQMNLFN